MVPVRLAYLSWGNFRITGPPSQPGKDKYGTEDLPSSGTERLSWRTPRH